MTLTSALETPGLDDRSSRRGPTLVHGARGAAQIEVVVPVYNEEAVLERSIRRLHDHLVRQLPWSFLITIVDNASTDRTWGIACRLAGELDEVVAIHLAEKGRGRALRAAWRTSAAEVVAYMDVDLSTDLDALLPLVAPLVSGHSDVAIGTRLASGSRVVRGPRREAISRAYNLILRATLRSGFSDAQCGFKAIRTDEARRLLPLVEDDGWFFDTELLVLAEHNGLRIHEVPVDWVDDPDSRVDVVATAAADLRGLWRLSRRLARPDASLPGAIVEVSTPEPDLAGQLVRFSSIGLVSTVVFAALFVLLRPALGTIGADVAALVICAVANTAANRRLTFALRGRGGRRRHYAAGALVALAPLALNIASLVALRAAGVTDTWAILLVLMAVNGVASFGRFVLLRRWVFRRPT
jgi:putative flippase GtrA